MFKMNEIPTNAKVVPTSSARGSTRLSSAVSLASTLLFTSQAIQATVLLDNTTGTTGYITSTAATQMYRACGFTMSTQSYSLDDIQMALRLGGGTAASSQTFVEVRTGTSTVPSTTVVATLNPNPLDGTGYTTTATVTSFTPAAAATLQASTTYWIVMRTASTTNYLLWSQTSAPTSNVTPTSSVSVSFLGCKNSTDNATWTASILKMGLQINGTLITPPVAPSSLSATAVSATQIDLAWTDNSSDETGFKIERPAGTLINTTAVNANSYSNTGLTCGTSYTYSVKATGLGGDSTAVTASATTAPCPSAEMDVQGNTVSIVDGDTTPATADDTDFGTVTVGNNVSKTYTIANTGTASLTLSGTPLVALSGAGCAPFGVTTQPTVSSVPATTGTTTFAVQYTPTATGIQTCTVTIANNDSNENPYNFNIQGTGTAAPVSEMDVQGNTVSIADGDTTPATADDTDFGTVTVGNNVSKTYTIANTGTAAVLGVRHLA